MANDCLYSSKTKQTFLWGGFAYDWCAPPPPDTHTHRTPPSPSPNTHKHGLKCGNRSISWRHQVYFTGNSAVWNLPATYIATVMNIKYDHPKKNKFTKAHDFPAIIQSTHILWEVLHDLYMFIDFRWHLGFCSLKCTPLQRGYDSFMGFFNAMGDHYIHTSFGKNAWAYCFFHYVS